MGQILLQEDEATLDGWEFGDANGRWINLSCGGWLAIARPEQPTRLMLDTEHFSPKQR